MNNKIFFLALLFLIQNARSFITFDYCAQREFLINALGAFDVESGLRSSSNERISVVRIVSLGKRKCIMQSHQQMRLLGHFYEISYAG